MSTHEWSQHWRDIEQVREQCSDPNACIGGDATVREALQYAQQHEPVVWRVVMSAAASIFSEGGHRSARDMNRAIEMAVDHYFAAQRRVAA